MKHRVSPLSDRQALSAIAEYGPHPHPHARRTPPLAPGPLRSVLVPYSRVDSPWLVFPSPHPRERLATSTSANPSLNGDKVNSTPPTDGVVRRIVSGTLLVQDAQSWRDLILPSRQTIAHRSGPRVITAIAQIHPI